MASGTAAAEQFFLDGMDIVFSGFAQNEFAFAFVICGNKTIFRNNLVHELPLFLVFIDNFNSLGGGNFAVNLAIDHHNGSQTAGTDAAESGDGEKTVFSGMGISLDTEDTFQFGKDLFGTFDVAGSSHADIDAVFAFGFGTEVVIETDHTGNLCFGEEKFLRNMLLDFAGQITEDLLSLVQHLDQSSAPPIIVTVNAESGDKRIKFCELFSGTL